MDRRWIGSSWFLPKEPIRTSELRLELPVRDKSPATAGPWDSPAAQAGQAKRESVLSVQEIDFQKCTNHFHAGTVVGRVALCEWTRSAFSPRQSMNSNVARPPFPDDARVIVKTFRPKIEAQCLICRSGSVGGLGFIHRLHSHAVVVVVVVVTCREREREQRPACVDSFAPMLFMFKTV